jgi:quercetin dioxygenase-like cupin family protein
MERPTVVDIKGAELHADGPGITVQADSHGDIRYAVVEYVPGAGRDEWCHESHQGYVLAGTIRYELADGELRATAGQAFVLPAGTPHRGSNPGREPARLFLVDHES